MLEIERKNYEISKINLKLKKVKIIFQIKKKKELNQNKTGEFEE